MYTRTYNDSGEIIIPEHYGGTSFGKAASEEEPRTECGDGTGKNPWEKAEEIHTSAEPAVEEDVKASAIGRKSTFSGLFSGILKNGKFGFDTLGKEELLIIATAAFLLFSKEGDKECAIMLLLLLFLN